MNSADLYPRFMPQKGVALTALAHEFGGAYAGASRDADDAIQAAEAARTTAPAPTADPAISGVVIDNRVVRAGDLFAALTGANRHGADFVPAAVAAGAAAVWTDARGIELLRTHQPQVFAQVPVIVSDEPRELIGPMAARIMDDPAADLQLVGITGSNGKTTTAFLVSAALAAHYGTFALRGTVGTRLGGEEIASERTTAEGPELQEFFAIMRQRDIRAGVLEVSSHAIALHRVAGAHFKVVGFTNLQRDHLDFHGDMETYFQAKLAFLQPEYAARAVICVDDEWGARASRAAGVPVETLSTAGASADWQVINIEPRLTAAGEIDVGAQFTLVGPDARVNVETHLVGSFNIANAALAILLAYRAGVPLEEAARAVGAYPGVPGRMEHVFGRAPGPLAIVDYAHAPDSVLAAAQAARPLTPGRLILAVGAGGNRDEGKRFFMGEAAAQGADVVVIADDNPRFEDPATIRAEVRRGAESVPGIKVLESDSRRAAVELCAELATEADTVLFVGKGHETTQDVRGEKSHFDDREELRRALTRRWS